MKQNPEAKLSPLLVEYVTRMECTKVWSKTLLNIVGSSPKRLRVKKIMWYTTRLPLLDLVHQQRHSACIEALVGTHESMLEPGVLWLVVRYGVRDKGQRLYKGNGKKFP